MSAISQAEIMPSTRLQTNRRRRESAPASEPSVLHVLDHSWPVLSGYSVRSRNLITSQHRLGYSVAVVTSPLHQLDDVTATNVTVDEVAYTRTPIQGGLAAHALRSRWPMAREYAVVRLLRDQILKIITRESVQVLYAHSPALCGLAALQVARETGLPCVYEIRAFWEDAAADRVDRSPQWRSRMTRSLETYVAKRADAVAAISKPMLHDLRSRGIPEGKLFYVPNGVDMSHFSPIAKDEALARELKMGEGLVFGFFGSLYRYEGVSWLIRALAKLRSSGQRFQILIIGRGEDESAIRKAVRECNAGGYVNMLAHVPYEQIGRYYSVVDIAVYPRKSIRLTELVTPLKPLEAMALGKPILASGVGGIQELVDSGRTGLLFQPENEEDFCRQAIRMLASPCLRGSLAENGRQFVVRERDWNVLARTYAEIYRFVLSRRAQGIKS